MLVGVLYCTGLRYFFSGDACCLGDGGKRRSQLRELTSRDLIERTAIQLKVKLKPKMQWTESLDCSVADCWWFVRVTVVLGMRAEMGVARETAGIHSPTSADVIGIIL